MVDLLRLGTTVYVRDGTHMRALSSYFIPVLKDVTSEAVLPSHKLMLKAGLMKQTSAGIYVWLPLAARVLEKISDIVRVGMDEIGMSEVIMPCIQGIDLWERSGRLSEEGDLTSQMLRIKDRKDVDLTFSPTGEEMVVDFMSPFIQSYKQLPKMIYQIQWKFRDEIRPRYGALRSREFLMKDAYSIAASSDETFEIYKAVMLAYMRIYEAIGLKAIPVAADNGGMGGSYSHEFHIIADHGESKIFVSENAFDQVDELVSSDDPEKLFNGLSEIYAREEATHDSSVDAVCHNSIEIGHIFNLEDKYTKAMNMRIQDKDGKLVHPSMASYGIGISRLLAAIIEVNHDDSGIIWPTSVAPFEVGIINLDMGNVECDNMLITIYDMLIEADIEFLVDDTEDNPGVKFRRMDLIGLPWVISFGTKEPGIVRVKERRTGTISNIPINEFLSDFDVNLE